MATIHTWIDFIVIGNASAFSPIAINGRLEFSWVRETVFLTLKLVEILHIPTGQYQTSQTGNNLGDGAINPPGLSGDSSILAEFSVKMVGTGFLCYDVVY